MQQNAAVQQQWDHHVEYETELSINSSNAAYSRCIAYDILFCRCEIMHIDVNVSRMNSRTCELCEFVHGVHDTQ